MSARALATLAGREWRTAWTQSGGYTLRAFYALSLLVVSAGAWGVLAPILSLRPEEYAGFARASATWFFRLQLLLGSFLAAIVYSRSLAREKERGTLELLLLSRLRGFEILLGKVMGDYLGMLAALAAGIPVLLFLLPLGGITFGEMISAHLIVGGQLAAVGGVCAALAALLTRPYTVMLLAWAVVSAVLGAPYVGRYYWPSAAAAWNSLEEWTPLAVLERELATVWTDLGPSAATFAGGVVVLLLGCSAGSLFLERFHSRQRDRAREGFWRTLKRRMVQAASARALGVLFRPLIARSSPLMRRECALERDLAFRVGWLGFVALYAGAIVLLLVRPQIGFVEDHVILAGTGGLVALLLATVRASISVGADRRNGLFETFLAANVEPEEIVRARLTGVVLRASYLMAVPAVHAAILYVGMERFSLETVWRLLLGLAGVAGGLVLAMAMTVQTSLIPRRTDAGAVLSILTAVPAALLAGLLVAASPFSFALTLPFVIASILGTYALAVRRFRRSAFRIG